MFVWAAVNSAKSGASKDIRTARKRLPIRCKAESTVAIDALSALFGSGDFANVGNKISTK